MTGRRQIRWCAAGGELTGWASAGVRVPPLARGLGSHGDSYCTRLLSGDLSRMMRNIVAGMGAISLRRAGGRYCGPVAERPALERLRRLLAALPHRDGQEPQLCALGVLDRVQARRQLSQAVHSTFTDDRAVLRTQHRP